jgi:hypothetical protein
MNKSGQNDFKMGTQLMKSSKGYHEWRQLQRLCDTSNRKAMGNEIELVIS